MFLVLYPMNSRQDFYFGDPQPFNKEVFDETRSYWTAPTVDVQMAANAMMARQATSNATNPDFELSELGDRFATGESAAYIIVLGDKVGGTVQRSVVEYLFGESSPSLPPRPSTQYFPSIMPNGLP